eukprot:s2753_g2.t1
MSSISHEDVPQDDLERDLESLMYEDADPDHEPARAPEFHEPSPPPKRLRGRAFSENLELGAQRVSEVSSFAVEGLVSGLGDSAGLIYIFVLGALTLVLVRLSSLSSLTARKSKVCGLDSAIGRQHEPFAGAQSKSRKAAAGSGLWVKAQGLIAPFGTLLEPELICSPFGSGCLGESGTTGGGPRGTRAPAPRGAPMHSEASQYHVKFLSNVESAGHTCYTIEITHGGSRWQQVKRYRELRELHDELKLKHGEILPPFPGKRFFGNSDPAFVAQRQEGLERYLVGVLQLDPDVTHPALRSFLGGPTPSLDLGPSAQEKELLELRIKRKCFESLQSSVIKDVLRRQLLTSHPSVGALEERETTERRRRFVESMKLSVLAQPVDPVILRDLGLDGDPVPISQGNGERLTALKEPCRQLGRAPNARMKTALELFEKNLPDIHAALRPAVPLADSSKLIATFPRLPYMQDCNETEEKGTGQKM